jgi:OOP family OmpA-OmpF porin
MRTSILASRSCRLALVTLASVGCVEYATAADDNVSGPYIGAAYGTFDVSIDDADLEQVADAVGDIDADNGAWKVFFGWRFNPFISLELDYIDLGNPSANFDASGSDGEYSVDLAGIAGYVIGTLPITIFELSARVGYYFHDVTIDVDTGGVGSNNGDVLDSDESGEAFVYGVGAGITLIERIPIMVEYEVMDLDEVDDAYTLWLSAAWRF